MLPTIWNYKLYAIIFTGTNWKNRDKYKPKEQKVYKRQVGQRKNIKNFCQLLVFWFFLYFLSCPSLLEDQWSGKFLFIKITTSNKTFLLSIFFHFFLQKQIDDKTLFLSSNSFCWWKPFLTELQQSCFSIYSWTLA